GAIENERPADELDRLVSEAVTEIVKRNGGAPPHRAILGCTHFPIVEALFRRHLPPHTRLLSQPEIVADSLDDYLVRHPEFVAPSSRPGVHLLTTGDAPQVESRAHVFWPEAPAFHTARTFD